MARGWHYTKLSLSSALLLSFYGICILLLFLSFCCFCFVSLCFFCSCWSFVNVPLIIFCPADHVPDWRPRSILLGMVEARSANVKKTTTTTTTTLSLQLKNLSNANPICGHKEVRRSTGHIMVTTHSSNRQGYRSRQNLCQVQPTANIGNLSASRRCLYWRIW